jgi:general stress protein YciG
MEAMETPMQEVRESRTRNRGFASMDREKQREIARKGGRAAHEKGTAHQFTSDEARAAGRKGGERVSSNREHMSRIGRLGGKSSAGRRQSDSPDNKGQDTADQGMQPQYQPGNDQASHDKSGE